MRATLTPKRVVCELYAWFAAGLGCDAPPRRRRGQRPKTGRERSGSVQNAGV